MLSLSVLWRNSPLPSSLDTDASHADNMAWKMSILFTDIRLKTLTKLNSAPGKANIAAALSVTHGALFAQHSSEFLRKRATKEELNTDSPDRLLKGKWKQEYLDYLREEWGLEGLYAFLTNFVGSLAKRENRRRKRQGTEQSSNP